jgi:hypothetical protein
MQEYCRLKKCATVLSNERACELADIKSRDVNLVQRAGEITPKNLPENLVVAHFGFPWPLRLTEARSGARVCDPQQRQTVPIPKTSASSPLTVGK